MIGLACAVLSGVAFYFSIQLGSQWWLAWLAPLPALWFVFGGARWWKAVLVCWAAYAIGMCNMIPAYWGELPDAVVISSILLPGFGLAAIALAARVVADRLSPLAGICAFAAIWTSVFYLLSFGPDGTASSWAYSQVGAPVLIQSASLFGISCVSFVLVFVPAGFAMALARGSKVPAIAAALLFVANAGFGYARLAQATSGEVVRVGLGGDDAIAGYRNDAKFTRKAVANYVAAARSLAAENVSLIVFPEKVAALTAETRGPAIAKLREAARASHATIVIGFDDRSGPIRRNAALIVEPDGTVGQYDKRHMVPGLEDAFIPGHGGFMLANHTGVAICKDMDFPRTLRADASRQPTLLAVPAWDFDGDRWWHARLAIMRGVENGFAVARVAKDGLLTLTDAYGRVLAEKPTVPSGMVTLVGDLPRGPGDTLYRRIGDVFAWAAIALAIGLRGWAFAARKND